MLVPTAAADLTLPRNRCSIKSAHSIQWWLKVYSGSGLFREKQYHRVTIRKIFLIVEFNFNIFISVGLLDTKLKLPLHWPERLVGLRNIFHLHGYCLVFWYKYICCASTHPTYLFVTGWGMSTDIKKNRWPMKAEC